MIDACGVCSNGLTNHPANSDMDCLGVCFGNYTTNCDIHLTTHSLDIPMTFMIDQEETSTSTMVFINNTSILFLWFWIND